MDSLLRRLQKQTPAYSPADSTYVQSLCDLAFHYRNNAIELADSLAQAAASLATSINYSRGLSRAMGYQGMMAYRQGHYYFAIEHHLQSLQIALKIKDSTLISFRYNDLANVYIDMGELEKAMEYNLKSLEIKQARGDQEGIATSYRNVGTVHLRSGNYHQAYDYLSRASQLAGQIGDKRVLAYSYIYLGQLFTQKKQGERALIYLTRAVEQQREIKNEYGECEALNGLAEAYITLGQWPRAMSVFKEALQVAENAGINLEAKRALRGLSEVSEALGKAEEALGYYKKFTEVQTQMHDQKDADRIAWLEAQFRNELKEAQIKMLTQQQQIAEQNVEKERFSRRFYTIMAIVAFVMLLVGAIAAMHNKKQNRLLYSQRESLTKQNELLNRQKEEIETQAAELQQLNAFKNKLFSIIAHDLRSPMASLKGMLDILSPEIIQIERWSFFKEELSRQFKTTDDTLQNLLLWSKGQMEGEQLATIAVKVADVAEAAIALLTPAAEAKSIRFSNDTDPEAEACTDKTHLSIILRNLLANAIKFSHHGGVVRVKSFAEKEQLVIAVEDQGQGMTTSQKAKLFSGEHVSTPGTAGEKGSGLGLELARNLVEKNKGKLWVESEAGKGSTFYFSLPGANLC